ncbi:RHS repeat-associated core domain-containing protein [Streptomyces sp. NPDC048636]|uniref:RHS repeat-associated core domain-containing protein n=1 Tax=Streptomyces sp. NPDC048636 TaxID=3155762 RepID=UPI003432C993
MGLDSWDGTHLAEQLSPDGTVATCDYTHRTRDGHPGNADAILALADVPLSEYDVRFHAIITDLAGAPTDLVTPDGSVAWQARTTTLWGTPLTAPSDATTCQLRFPGQYADPETGFHYNHHRYYGPETHGYDVDSLPRESYGGGKPMTDEDFWDMDQ